MEQMKRIMTLALAVLAMVASPVMAQKVAGSKSDGEAFLSALREGNGTKAYNLAEGRGSTVVNYRGEDGSAALHLVTRSRNSNWMGFLLANGADPDIADRNGDTPLILAARSGYGEGVARLLMARASVDKPNKLGETALIAAVQARQAKIVSALLKLGADPDKADHASGYTARDYAKRDNRSNEMLRLIETVKSQKARIAGPSR
jgi:ankyrin repeat protein